MFSRHGTTIFAGLLLAALTALADARAVSSLGRIEPLDGVYRLAGPSELAVVSELRVKEGDRVQRGQVLATLDTHALLLAQVKRAEVGVDHARRVLTRNEALKQGAFQSQAALDEAERDLELRLAELVAARAQLDRASVKAPVAGQVLIIHARQGERIGPNGLLELGQTEHMYAVAEVYETDIALVSPGQSARVTSPALSSPARGTVERIGMMVAKNDALGLDPVARTDSRIVEVFVLLDDPTAVASLTNLQVSVEIGE
ncbi:MAG: efflux RND transporter periplasmic adaptor subunit [Pseudomonadales bacterium]